MESINFEEPMQLLVRVNLDNIFVFVSQFLTKKSFQFYILYGSRGNRVETLCNDEMKGLLKNYSTLDRKRKADESEEAIATASNKYEPSDNQVVFVVFRCWEGSVTHYYHFFFGALIPLIEYYLENLNKKFVIRSDIGPMKRILCELPLILLEFVGPSYSNGHAIAHDDKSLGIKIKSEETALPSYDKFNSMWYDDKYVPQLPKLTALKILDFFKNTIPDYISSIETFPIIIIQRGNEPYYSKSVDNSRSAIYATSGNTRRSILNHDELMQRIQSKYPDISKNIILEGSSIYYQYHMFKHAKVVVAQHGAALSNVFFMKPHHSTLIEISPPWSKALKHFSNLADYCDINYMCIDQETDHSAVNIDHVIHAIDSVFVSNDLA